MNKRSFKREVKRQAEIYKRRLRLCEKENKNILPTKCDNANVAAEESSASAEQNGGKNQLVEIQDVQEPNLKADEMCVHCKHVNEKIHNLIDIVERKCNTILNILQEHTTLLKRILDQNKPLEP